MTIIDRRQGGKNKLSGSREKFLNRYKNHIKQHIQNHIKNTPISDVGKDVKIRTTNIKSGSPYYDMKKSIYKNVHPGNKQYNKGDTVNISKKNATGQGGGQGQTELLDEYINFHLTKDEFLDLLFADMALPNFLKKSEKYISKTTLITGGYTKVGVPARLAIKKTFENSIKRRIALRTSHAGKRFLDDIDIRYRDLIELKRPVSHAVMFCVLDVSGSMCETRRLIAKKFFLLLYLFLNKNYKQITIRFIGHTSDAFELQETEFFSCQATGGTILSSPIKLINKIITNEYDADSVNIYVAHASDGENWEGDYPDLKEELNDLLLKIQYFIYLEVDQRYPEYGATAFFKKHMVSPKLVSEIIKKESDVYPVLQKIFKAEGDNHG